MRNTNLVKTANLISLFLTIAILVVPLAVGAQFNPPASGGTGLPSDNTATAFIFRIIQILLAVAGVVAVIFLIIGGFRYITAGGNEETAESARKTLTNAIIGIVIIILAFVIVNVIANALVSSNV